MPFVSSDQKSLLLIDHLRRAPVIVGFGVFVAVLFLPGWLNDPDTYWHIVTGQWIIHHRSVPMADIFSWTMPGRRWVAHEWLAETFMALAYDVAGFSGVTILMAAAFALTGALMIGRVERSFRVIGFMLFIVCGLLPAGPDLVARPHILAMPCMMAWTYALLDARRRGVAPSLFCLPLMSLWANLHGGFMVGIGMSGFFALEAVLLSSSAMRWRAVAHWALFCSGAVGAAALTPRGLEGLWFPFELMRMKTLNSIVEWGASTVDNGMFIGLLGMVGLYLVFVRRLRLGWMRLVLLVALTWNACLHARNQMLMGLIGTAIVADAMASKFHEEAEAEAERVRLAAPWACALLAGLAILAMIVRIEKPIPRLSASITPEEAVDRLDPAIASGPGYNEYGFGGYLIFRGIRPFIDGRLDMYGDAFMTQYLALNKGGAALTRYLAHSPIRWALVRTKTGAATTLAHLPGWRQTYADKVAELYVRE